MSSEGQALHAPALVFSINEDQAPTPCSASNRFMRAAVRSGSLGSPAASASRNASARWSRERARYGDGGELAVENQLVRQGGVVEIAGGDPDVAGGVAAQVASSVRSITDSTIAATFSAVRPKCS